MLEDVNVAIGVTGSIAAVRCVELIHELRRRGAAVRVLVSEAATSIVHPNALAFASDHDAITALTGDVEHIKLCGRDGWADALLIAPATANTVGKLAAAIDDTPVTTAATTAIGSDLPVVVAPAMHAPMHDHPGVEANLRAIREDYGVDVVPPMMAEGKAKLASDDAIALAVARAVDDRPLTGAEVVVTSGPTTEAIDPVRALTTRASGRTGRAVARAAYVRGADVTLIHDGPEVPYATVHRVGSAAEMADAAVDTAGTADAFVAAAAVSDFTVDRREEKIPSDESLTLTFEPTPKVIGRVREAAPSLAMVGFKAESSASEATLLERARGLQAEHDLAFVVANDAAVMGEDTTRVLLVNGDDVDALSGTKTTVGRAIAARLATVLDG